MLHSVQQMRPLIKVENIYTLQNPKTAKKLCVNESACVPATILTFLILKIILHILILFNYDVYILIHFFFSNI